jgi:hypothetical protein
MDDPTEPIPDVSEMSADQIRTAPGQRSRLDPSSRRLLRQLARRGDRSGRLSPRGYNLTISHTHKFVWFRVAKVATRTILSYFDENDVLLDVPRGRRLRYPTELFADYRKFAFVRHPETRFLSAWQDKVVSNNYFGFDPRTRKAMRNPTTFAEWVGGHDLEDLDASDQHLALQTRLIDLTQVDDLGRLEHFDRDFTRILGRLGLPARQPLLLNASSAHARTKVDRESLRLVLAQTYRKDYEILGYPLTPT